MKRILFIIAMLASVISFSQDYNGKIVTAKEKLTPPKDTTHSKSGLGAVNNWPAWGDDTSWHLTPRLIISSFQVGDFVTVVDTTGGVTLTNTHPTDQACNNTSNISITHLTGLIYGYNAGDYYIGCKKYSILFSGTFAVDTGTAGAGEFREDLVYLDAGGLHIKKGTNSIAQVAEVESADPATQIELGHIRVDENNVVTTGPTALTIYDENNPSTEFAHTTTNMTVSFIYNALAPYNGDSSIRITAASNNGAIMFRSPVKLSQAGFTKISFWVNNRNTFNNNRNWVLRLYNGATQVAGSAAVTLTANRGYSKTLLNSWQLISFDLSLFGGNDVFDGFQLRNTGTGGTVNVQFDFFRFENGVTTVPVAGTQNAPTTFTANQNAAHVDRPNDNINILGGKNIYTRGDGIKTITIEDGVNTTDNNNFKKDSIVLYTPPDYTHTFTAAGWTKAANFNTFATETVVAGGVQIASSHTGIGSDWIYAPWHSMADNTTMEMTFTLDVIGGSNPLIGFVRNSFGAITVGGIMYLALDEININGSTAGFNHWNLHDLIRMRFSLDYSTYKVDVYNITQNKFDSYTYAGSNYAYITTSAPAIYITNATITVKDFRFYSRNYNPDLMIAGDSHWLQAGGSVPIGYDSTTGGRIQRNSNLNVSVFAKSSATLQLFLASFPEFKKLKPKKVLFDVGFVNVFNGDAVGTWGPLYQAAVDSILNMGCKVTLVRDFPATTTETAPIGLFIDSIYANDTDVNIIDLYATTPMYDAGDAFHHDAAYFEPDIYGHPNNAGAKAIADYILPRLKNFGRYRSAGGGGGGGGGSDSPDRINGTATIDVNSDVTGHYQRFLYDHLDGHSGYLQFSSGDEGFKTSITDGTITMRYEMSFDGGYKLRYSDGSGTYEANMGATGLNYTTDISSVFTDRSLPDVGYVKKIVSDTAQNIISNLLIVFKGTATLNFGSTSASSSNDLTITATGASVGDPVSLGLPASIDANSTYTAWVSATNTVTVRFNNYQSVGAIDPASGTFKVIVYKY